MFVLYATETINMFSLMDSCHSGSAFDLKYYLNPQMNQSQTTQNEMKASIVMISGCKDDQYSQSSVFMGNGMVLCHMHFYI